MRSRSRTLRAAAAFLELPLYRYIGGTNAKTLPVPMMNILNGGAHADNNVDFQEFMVMPVGAESFREALRMRCGDLSQSENRAQDRAAIRPASATKAVLLQISNRTKKPSRPFSRRSTKAGYKAGENVMLALDPAASEFYKDGKYVFKKTDKRELSSERNGGVLGRLVRQISDHLDRGRHGRERLGRLEKL